MLNKILYRAWQFWQTVTGRLSPQDRQEVASVLSPDQLALFKKMPEPEQAHAVRVLRALKGEGHQDPDLLAAGLLHDVGKCRYPLRVWDRAWIVLAGALLTSKSNPKGDRLVREDGHPLVIAERHPTWGAEMARRNGSSPLTVWLIRNHERRDVEKAGDSRRGRFLNALIRADDRS
ncbi:MAG: HD domain-containing protein [Chloroflexota bacterium]